jgi:hypothetical protein
MLDRATIVFPSLLIVQPRESRASGLVVAADNAGRNCKFL